MKRVEGTVGAPDDELDIDEYYEKHKEAIEAACERIRNDKTKALEGYYTLTEFDELFKKKLAEAYEEQNSIRSHCIL